MSRLQVQVYSLLVRGMQLLVMRALNLPVWEAQTVAQYVLDSARVLGALAEEEQHSANALH